LCIDDEPINLFIIKKLLGKNFEVITAEEGGKALLKMENDPDINLIITDMSMPCMTGLDFIKEASKRFKNKKYFMLSGYAITQQK
jgi:YesN/AraC family two-component response regulator